nr:zinc finger, CCHC-type [Tanacetum cinerariifolium]
MQVTLHDKRIVMQDTLHYEAIVMQVTLHDKRIVMQVTLHYEEIVIQVTLHDKRIVVIVRLQDEEIKLEYSSRLRSLKMISKNTGLHSYRFSLFLLTLGSFQPMANFFIDLGPEAYDETKLVLDITIVDDKLNYLEHPIPTAPVPAHAGQHVPPEALATHDAWVKGQKEISSLMLMTMELDIQRNQVNLGAFDMLHELKTLFSQQAEQALL